jgi:peptide/nickel transport system permease protein
MLKFLLRRILLLVPVLAGLLILTFVMVRFLPTDPAHALAGEQATPEQVERIREEYGLNKPVHEQFLTYVQHVAEGDLGRSFTSGQPVLSEVSRRLPATIELALAAMIIAVGMGIPLGTWAALHRGRRIDEALRILSVSGLAIAPFWFAIMLQLLFAMDLDILPVRGRLDTPSADGFVIIHAFFTGQFARFLDGIAHIAMPAFTLGFAMMATILRFTRSGVLETLPQDYVTYASAMGVRHRRLVWVYVLRNSVVSVVTQIGLLTGTLIANAVVVEAIFDWPGIGSYAVSAILASDYQATLAVTLVVGTGYALINILVDAVQAAIDPRVRQQL